MPPNMDLGLNQETGQPQEMRLVYNGGIANYDHNLKVIASDRKSIILMDTKTELNRVTESTTGCDFLQIIMES